MIEYLHLILPELTALRAIAGHLPCRPRDVTTC